MTLNDGAHGRRAGGDRRYVMALLLLLLVALIGAAWWLQYTRNTEIDTQTGTFRTTFTGCDRQGRCGDFRIVAPGYDYRWSLDSTRLDALDGREPELASPLAADIRAAEAVISVGLASREGADDYNRRLSACRSKRLAVLIDDAQAQLGSRVPSYRVVLGRYAEAQLVGSGGVPLEGDGDTSIERLVVLGLVMRSDQGLNLDEALKDGLLKALPSALAEALGPIRRQLDFTRYACWNNEFRVTPTAQQRSDCFREPAADNAFCSGF